jgi:hypothetical protein
MQRQRDEIPKFPGGEFDSILYFYDREIIWIDAAGG